MSSTRVSATKTRTTLKWLLALPSSRTLTHTGRTPTAPSRTRCPPSPRRSRPGAVVGLPRTTTVKSVPLTGFSEAVAAPGTIRTSSATLRTSKTSGRASMWKLNSTGLARRCTICTIVSFERASYLKTEPSNAWTLLSPATSCFFNLSLSRRRALSPRPWKSLTTGLCHLRRGA